MKLVNVQQIRTLFEEVLLKIKLKYATKQELEESVGIKGPNGETYTLLLDDEYKLKALLDVSSTSVDYLVSGTEFYYIEDDVSGNPSFVKATSVGTDKSSGCIRVVDTGTFIKYQITIENGEVVFNEVADNISTEDEAGKLICQNNPNKVYSFKMYNGNIYLEAVTTEIFEI